MLPTEESNSVLNKDSKLGKNSNTVVLTTDIEINKNDFNNEKILNDVYDELVKKHFLNVKHTQNFTEVVQNEELENLKRHIIRHRSQLESVQKKIQTISFTTENELLRKLENPNYGNILENINQKNYKDCLQQLHATRKSESGPQTLKNIITLESGSDQIQNIIEEAIKNTEV